MRGSVPNPLAGVIVLAAVAGLAGVVSASMQDMDEAMAAYEEGDYETAYDGFRSAAEAGDAEAQRMLAGMYRMGRGVAPDNAEAAKWYREAAGQGHPVAQYILGGLYLHGQGIEQDDVQAHVWFSLAADQGQAGAREMRDNVESRMTAEDIAEAERLAQQWEAR